MNAPTIVGIEVRAEGTQAAARDLGVVDASLQRVRASIGSVSQFSSTAGLDRTIADLGEMGVAINTNSRHMQNLARAMQQVERERAFQQLAQSANLSTLQLARLRAEMGDTHGALTTLTNGFGLSKTAVLAFAAALAFGGKAALDAALQMDRLEKAYTTITGNSSAAQAQLAYLYETSNRLGLQFQSTAEGAKAFFAAGKGSSLEKDLNSIFEAMSSAGAALALSQDDMHGAFIALGQMISKGKVQAEELRGQLGERLPGAFQLAAKAMNMTTAELDKFMSDGKLTAEVLLPKLAKAMQEDFGAAAMQAANGIQGQLNRLSTEWTRFKAGMIDSDSAAKALGLLAEAMKTLADNGEMIATVFSKGLQWVAWAAGIYALIKAASGLVLLFTTLRTIVSAVSFAGIAAAAGPVAVALGLVAVAVGSVIMEQDKGAEIGKRYAAVSSDIEAALKKQAQAAKDAKDGTEQLSESQKKLSVSQAIEDQAQAMQEMQSLATGKGWLEMLGLGGEPDEAVAKIKEKTAELLTVIRTGQGDASSLALEIDKMGASSNEAAAFAAKIIEELIKAEKAGKIAGEGYTIATEAANALVATLTEAKAVMASPWAIDVSDAVKSIAALEKGIRAFQAERLGMKDSKLTDILFEFSPEAVKSAQDAYSSKGFGVALKELGITIGSLTEEQEKNLNTVFRLQKQYDAEAKTTEAYRNALRTTAKSHTSAYNQMENNAASYRSEVEQTEASIRSLEAQLATKPGEVFSREQAKILADYGTACAKINEEADKYTRKKGITKTQTEELKNQKLMEASLQRDLSLRQAQEKEEKRLADLAKDRYQFYKELEEITGQYGLSLKYQNELIKAQVEELQRLGIPAEYIRQWKELKDLQASHDWVDGARRGLMEYQSSASDAASGAEEAFSSLFNGMDSGWRSAWQQMIETGKVSLSSFRSLFASFLADIMHMAITRPITVQIADVVSGMLGTGGIANAATGTGGTGGFGMPNMPVGSMIPNSWTSGISDSINNTMSAWFPKTFAANNAWMPGASSSAMGMIPGGGIGSGITGMVPSAGLPTIGTSFLGALGAGGMGFGIGSLAGSLLFPDKPNISMGSGIGGGLGAAIGSIVPGIGTLIGGGLGSLLGGGLGSLFGSKKPKRPAVTGSLNLDLGNADAFDVYDFRDTYDSKNYGKNKFQVTEKDYFTTASRDRNNAGQESARTMQSVLDSVAESAIAQAQAVQQALPEAYAKQFKNQLSQHRIRQTWDLKGDDISEDSFKQIAEDVQTKVNESMLLAFQGMDVSEYANRLKIDQSSLEGLNTFTTALSQMDSMMQTIDLAKNPLSDVEQQAKAVIAQVETWQKELGGLGWSSAEAAKADEYRTVAIDNMMKGISNSITPMSDVERQAEAVTAQIDGWNKALMTLGVAQDVATAKTDEYKNAFVSNIIGSIDALISPISDIEQQAKATAEQIDGWNKALMTLGVPLDSAIAKSNEYRNVLIESLVKPISDAIVPTTQYAAVVEQANRDIDSRIASLRTLGASEKHVAELEAMRGSYLAKATEVMNTALVQDMRLREAQLTGNTNLAASVLLSIQHERELAEARAKFGEGSIQYTAILQMQSSEMKNLFNAQQESVRAATEAARAAVETARQTVSSAQQQVADAKKAIVQHYADLASKAQSAFDTAKNAMVSAVNAWVNAAQSAYEQAENAYKSALQKKVSEAEQSVNASRELVAAVRDFKVSLWSSDTAPTGSQMSTTSSEYKRLLALAMGGDKDAAGKLQGAAQAMLESSYKGQTDYSAYLNDFYDVSTALDQVAKKFEGQASLEQQTYDALKAQLDAMGEQEKTLDQLLKEMTDARKTLDKTLAEQAAAYAKWGLEKVNPSLDALEREYREKLQALTASQQNLLKAVADSVSAESKYGAQQMQSTIKTLQDNLVRALDNLSGKITELKKYEDLYNKQQQTTGLKTQSQIIALRPDVTTAIQNGTQPSFAYWWHNAGKKEYPNMTWSGYEGSEYHSSNVFGSKYATENALLKAKVDRLIAENAAPWGRSWTVTKLRDTMKASGMTPYSWYINNGKAEGFAEGGVTPRNRPFWVGERGPELMMSPQQYGVLDNVTSRALTGLTLSASPAASRDGRTLKKMDMLTGEVSGMKSVLRAILTLLDRSGANAEKTIGLLRMWDAAGIPKERTS